jgi:cysteine desulfurase
VPSIVGLSHALRLAVDRQDLDFHHVEKLRSVLLTELESLSDVQILGGNAASPFILAIAFYGVQGEAVVIDMDRLGFALSSGAACSSGTHELSHVLVRAQLDEHWARGMIRLSFGRANTMESSRECGIRLKEVVNRLRSGPNG